MKKQLPFRRIVVSQNKLPLLVFVIMFASVGTYLLFTSFAAGTSTITGSAWHDTNRNGVRDSGETPFANMAISIFNSDGPVRPYGVATDADGNYTFTGMSDGAYELTIGHEEYNEMRKDWTPTTTGSIFFKHEINLSGTAQVNFGLRQIVRSRTLGSPITSVRSARGTLVESYNDAVTAQQILDQLESGSLFGGEAPTTEVRFDFQNTPSTATSIAGSPGTYAGFQADSWIPWMTWTTPSHELDDSTLFHEYGHAWANYHNSIIQQNKIGDYPEYLQIRGIANDPRIGTSWAWDPGEMIAEDYRQLFGTPTAKVKPHGNTEIPPPDQVPGLREYLSGLFMTGAANDTTPPSAPTNLQAQTTTGVEGAEVRLDWNASTDNKSVAKYEIYSNNSKIGYVNAPTTTFVDSGLPMGTSYNYFVKALDAAGNSSNASNTVIITTAGLADTQAPTMPGALTITNKTKASLSLKWDASTDNIGVASYSIYQIGNGKTALRTLVGTTNQLGFTVTGLKSNTNYSFEVYALDTSDNISLPAKITGKTLR